MNGSKQHGALTLRRALCALFALLLAAGLLAPQAMAETIPLSSISAGSTYVRPTSASVNYYTYNGSTLSSLGLLDTNQAYLVTGSQTIGTTSYYMITVGQATCYVKASNVQMTTGAVAQTSSVAATPAEGTVAATSVAATSVAAGSNVTSTTDGSPIGTLTITPAGTTNMRAAAHMLSGNIVAKIKQNTVLPFYSTVVPPSGNHVWYYCYDQASGQYGYIVDDCVKVLTVNDGASLAQLPDKTPLQAAPTADPVLSNSQAVGYLRITPKGKTNIRKSARADANNVAAQAEQGDILPYYAVSVVSGESWYYVYYQPEAVFGYVRGNCVELTSDGNVTTVATIAPGATAIPVTFTNQAQGQIQLTASGVNMRKTPSTAAKVLHQFAKGEIIPYYDVTFNGSRTWYQVVYDGNTGYVLGDFCQVVSQTGAIATIAPSTIAGYLMTTADKVYVRKSASTSAGTYGLLQTAGTVLPLTGPAVTSGGVTWYPVSFDGKVGYVHGGYAAVLNDSQITAYQNGQPLPTATPGPTAAPKPVDYIITTRDKVWNRKSASTSAATKGQALLGAVFHYTGTTYSGGVQWYRIEYAGGTCYIMAKYCRVMTDAEYTVYQATNATPAPVATAVPALSEMSNIALTNTEKVILRAEGRSSGKQLALLYRVGKQVTLLGNTNVANNYTWYNVSVNGITGWIRGDLLRILTKAEADNLTATGNTGTANNGNSTGSSVNGVVLYRPELIDWNTGGIQDIFYKGCTAIVTDVKTGISFQVKRWSGGDHADVEPLTASDTAAMCRIYGVSKAQDISDKNLYQRHPVLVTLFGHSYAASMYGVPHNYPAGDTIPDNNFNGQFCLHFVNSRVHKSDKVDKDHQEAIMYAYNNAARLLGIN